MFSAVFLTFFVGAIVCTLEDGALMEKGRDGLRRRDGASRIDLVRSAISGEGCNLIDGNDVELGFTGIWSRFTLHSIALQYSSPLSVHPPPPAMQANACRS